MIIGGTTTTSAVCCNIKRVRIIYIMVQMTMLRYGGVMAVAKAFASNRKAPARSLLFICFAGEEMD